MPVKRSRVTLGAPRQFQLSGLRSRINSAGGESAFFPHPGFPAAGGVRSDVKVYGLHRLRQR